MEKDLLLQGSWSMGLGHLLLLIVAFQSYAPIFPQKVGDEGINFLDNYISKSQLPGP